MPVAQTIPCDERLFADMHDKEKEELVSCLAGLSAARQHQLLARQMTCEALYSLSPEYRVHACRFLLQEGALDLFGPKGYSLEPTLAKIAMYLKESPSPIPLPRVVRKLSFYLIKHGALHMRGFLERYDFDHLMRAFTTRVLHTLCLNEKFSFNVPLCIDPEATKAPWGEVLKDRIKKCWLLSYIESPQRARPSEEALTVSASFNRFTDLNYRALYHLNRHDKDVAACIDCLDALEEMLHCYLGLFRDVAPGQETGGLVAKFVEAEIFWNCRRQIEASLRHELNLPPDSDLPREVLLPPHTESLLMVYDGEKAARYIQANLSHLDKLERDNISVAELINILHQKGLAQGPELFDRLRQTGGRVITLISPIRNGNGSTEDDCRALRTNDFITFVDLRQSRRGGSMPFPVRVIVDAVTRNANIIPDSSRLKLIIYASELETHLDIKIGGHSARVHYSLAPPERGGRFALQYAEGEDEEGNFRRLQVMARAFRKAGLKVTVSGRFLEAVYDKDCGAAALDAIREKAALGLQILNSMPDLDYALGGFNGTYSDDASVSHFGYFDETAIEQILEAWAQHCYENGFFYLDLLRPVKKGEDQFYLKSELYWDGRGRYRDPYLQVIERFRADLDEALRNSLSRVGMVLWEEYRLGSIPLGQAFFDRLIDRENRALRHSLALLDERGFVRANPVIGEIRQHPVTLFIDYLKTDEMLGVLSRTANLAAQVATLGSWEDLGKLGGLWVSRLRISVIKDVLSFFVLRVPETRRILLAFATVGEDPLPIPFIDRVAEQIRPSNVITATDWIALILDLFGYRVETVPQQTETHWELIREYLEQPNPPDIDVGMVMIPGMVNSPGIVTGRIRANIENRPLDDFRDGILVDQYLTPDDDDKIQAARGVLITSGGELSHAAIRTREFKKPSLILKDVHYRDGVLTYVPHYNRALMTCYPFPVRGISVHACYSPPGNQQPITACDGDLIRLDAGRGQLLVLGNSQSLQQAYQLVLILEKHPEMENLWQEMKHELETLRDADTFLFLLSEWVLVQEVTSERLRDLLQSAKANPHHSQEVEGYLRHLLLDVVKWTDSFLQKQKLKIIRSHSLMELFYHLGLAIARCERLQNLEKVSLGAGCIEYPSEERLSVLSDLAREKIEQYRPEISSDLAAAADRSRHEESAAFSYLPGWHRLVRKARDVGLHETPHYVELFERLRIFQARKREELSRLQSCPSTDKPNPLFMAKDGLDSDFRPLVGGKAAHSGEILQALQGLREEGVCVPQGFASTTCLLRSLQENPEKIVPELDEELAVRSAPIVFAQLDHMKGLLGDRLSAVRDHPNWQRMQTILAGKEPTGADIVQTRLEDFCTWLEGLDEISADASLLAFARVVGRFAVRSSGIREDSREESFAGQKLTVLNVLGPQRLRRAVEDVLSSGAEAALVEAMVPAEVSGVAFSVNPGTGSFGEILVNSAYGLGEGVVSGQVDPDRLIIDKKTGRPLGQPVVGRKSIRIVPSSEYSLKGGNIRREAVPVELQRQVSLRDRHQLQLSLAMRTLEDHFGYPLDVEWAIDPLGRLFILQSRPITTLWRTLAEGKAFMGLGE